jgi:hypothetical protein
MVRFTMKRFYKFNEWFVANKEMVVEEWEHGDIILVTVHSMYKTMDNIGLDNTDELERSRKLNTLMKVLIMWIKKHPDWPYRRL